MLGLACRQSAPQFASTIRDSVGITIVENTDSVWRNNGWSLSVEPALSLGIADGDVDYQFFMVHAAILLGDGRIAIANAGTREIRFFDSVGRHLGNFGRAGTGPGEFRQIGWLQEVGSTVYAYDPTNRRITAMDSALTLIRMIPLRRLPERFVAF